MEASGGRPIRPGGGLGIAIAVALLIDAAGAAIGAPY